VRGKNLKKKGGDKMSKSTYAMEREERGDNLTEEQMEEITDNCLAPWEEAEPES